ncbi:MAG: hypothetical protein M1817_001976 [Caeruleum heppii]|nr:MAG: hypothetical protein M1817_001976 [Caeruleum heppii]
MLLTLKQPALLGLKTFHEVALPTPPPTSRVSFSPVLSGLSPGRLPPLPVSSDPSSSRDMATPHRGLPPPAAMTLAPMTLPAPAPAQQQQPPPPSLSQPMGHLPAAPPEWRNQEESMRIWLQTKQEEDKRRQEEEKTRQETLRLEQRRVEQSILHESLQAGIPPYFVPLIFAGMGGGNLPNASLEWAQHYIAQVHQLQQQQQQQQQQQHQHPAALPPPHHSPEPQREGRVVTQPPPNPYATQQPIQQVLGPPQHGQPTQPTFPAPYQMSSMSPSNRPSPQGLGPTAPTSAPRPAPHGVLPRLTTGEMQIQPPPQNPPGMPRNPAAHPLQQSQTAQNPPPPSQDPTRSSPNIYFHHYVPPNSQGSKDSKEPPTPSEYTSSPKKRKATGAHQSAPPPSQSQTSYTSPPFSQSGSAASTPSGRRPAHMRNRSDASSSRTYDSARPPSRPRQRDGGNGGSSGGLNSGAQGPPSGSMSDVSGGSHQTPPQRERADPQQPSRRHSAEAEERRGTKGSGPQRASSSAAG